MSLLSGTKLMWLWIEELFKSCPGKYKYKKQSDVFIVCGHRGSPVEEVENTIPSFELAMKQGANSIETDLCITKDNIVVLWHDRDPNDTNTLLREKGIEPDVKYKPFLPDIFSEFRKPINELTYDEFKNNFDYIEKCYALPAKAEIPTLNIFFEWAKTKNNLHYVFLDLKTSDSEPELAIEIISQVKQLMQTLQPEFKIIIETFNKRILIPLKEKFPEFLYSFDIELHPGIVLLPRKFSGVNKAIKYKNRIAIILRPRIITIANWVTYRRLIRYEVKRKEKYNLKHQDNMIRKVIGCTINDESEMECLIRIGIGGIQTDYPDKLAAITKKYNLKINSDQILKEKL